MQPGISEHLAGGGFGKGGVSGPGEAAWFQGEGDPQSTVAGGQAGE